MTILVRIICCLLLICTVEMANADSLKPAEEQMQHYLKTQQINQLIFLKKLVEINSGTMNLKGVHRVGDILRPQFKQLGFKTYWVREPSRFHRAPTFVAQRKGNNGKRVLLIGHLDTVFPHDGLFQHMQRQGHMITGPGVIDAKGGDIVILYALKALHSIHALDNTTITVVLTGDEEDSGKPTAISRRALIDYAKMSDVALDFECSFNISSATVARRGIANWTIVTEGSGLHSAAIFKKEAGDGAIFELARILDNLRMELSNEKYVTFNPGIILGGTTVTYDKYNARGMAFGKQNVIAKVAFAKGDIRFLTNEQKQTIERKMIHTVKNHLPGTTATITFEDGIPSMPPTAGNLHLLSEYSRASVDLGYGRVKLLDPGSRGAGDISHVAAYVPENLAGLGPVGFDAHSAKEKLDMYSLPIATERAALLIYRLTR